MISLASEARQMNIVKESNEPMGDQVKRIREALGMTQEQLAARCGLGQSYIADIENGRRGNLELSTVKKIAEGLECVAGVRLVLQKDISKILDERSTQVAEKIVAITSGSAALEMQLPDRKIIEREMKETKKDLLENHRSSLWQEL